MTTTDKESLAFVFKSVAGGFLFMAVAGFICNFSTSIQLITVTIAGITYSISAVITANLKIEALISEINALK